MTIAVPNPGGVPAASPADTTAQTEPTNKPYFVNFWVDAAFIGGISVIVFLALRLATTGDYAATRTQTVINWGIWLSWVINWPHFAATNYRLYRSKETYSQYPVTAFVVPMLLVPATIAALAMPGTFAPWFVKVFMVWSPYHFSGQTIGIAVLYARRSGFNITPLMRWALTWFVFATYIELQAKSEIPGSVRSFYGVTNIPSIGIPSWVATYAHVAVVLLGMVLVLAAIDAWGKADRKQSFPIIMAVPVITQLVWFKLAVGTWYTASFLEFTPLFHSLQYLFIAWFMQMKERQVIRDEQGSGRVVAQETLIWAVAIFIGGALMFTWGPKLIAFAFPVTAAVSIGVLQSTVQIHHFFVDGVIWKLRNPRIRGALNTSIGELVSKP